MGLRHFNYSVLEKKILILGAGGVVPSIIFALKKMGTSRITLSNRTKVKAENIKKLFPEVEVIDWGKTGEFNMIINATSLGLKSDDEIKINYNDFGKNKFFYDVIYNPRNTNFLKKAKELGNEIENGKKHQLISSVCISKNGSMIWNYTDKAELIMKQMNDDELKSYLSKITDDDLYAYNVYQIENIGKNLFSQINGDKNTIMGLPIKKIKEYLDNYKSF